jgi:uridylate kinase
MSEAGKLTPKYKRVILKLSGEALAGDQKSGLNRPVIEDICRSVKKCVCAGVQVGIVVGGGNFWRGRSGDLNDPVRSDHIGMLATTMNALAVADMLESLDVEVRVQTAIEMKSIAEQYIRQRALRHMEKGRVVVFGCGTGSPFFTTDSAAALRAAELCADILLKATMVDGVYDKDPHRFKDAVRYETLRHQAILANELSILDGTAAAMCRDRKIPLLVFDLTRPDNIYDAVMGEKIGTIVL